MSNEEIDLDDKEASIEALRPLVEKILGKSISHDVAANLRKVLIARIEKPEEPETIN